MLFRDRLKEGREAAGLTQQELADKSGVPLWTLRKHEQRSPQRVSLDVAVRLAKVIGQSCEYFASCTDLSTESAEDTIQKRPTRGRPKKEK